MARVFVVWDSRLSAVELTMGTLRDDPELAGGHQIDVLGALGDACIGVIDAQLKERLSACDGVLAFLDTPNANMAWELGMGLGLRREPRVRAAFATESRLLPAWTQGTLLAGVLSQPNGADLDVVLDLLGQMDRWTTLPAPEPGGRTLLLCPGEGTGKVVWAKVAKDLPGRLELLELKGVALAQLPARLRGVGRCAWVVPAGCTDDLGHGVENTVHALVAGFLDAAGFPLLVLRHRKAPNLVDLVGRTEEWFKAEELVSRLRTWCDETRPVGAPAGRTADDVLALWRDLVRERHAHTTPLLPARSDLTLDTVYVRVRVGAREGHHAAAPLRQVIEARLKEPGPVRAVVSGAPGSGKTTLARHLAWELAGDGLLPVYVPLAGLDGHPLDHADAELVEARAGAVAGALRAALAAAGQARGRVWLLLDGLDEVPQKDGAADPYRRCLQRIQALAGDAGLREVVIVVLSREVSAGDLPWDRLEVEPLDRDRQQELVVRLRDAELITPEVAASVLGQLGSWAEALVSNPLLLTLVALTAADRHGRGDRPVQDRVHVLQDAVRWLLSRRYRVDAGPQSHRQAEHVRVVWGVLRRLALRWHERGVERWTTEAVREALREVWAGLDGALKDDARGEWPGGWADLLDELDRQAGVVGRADGGLWGWLHRSMRELLAAEELAGWEAGKRAAYVDARIGEVPAVRGRALYVVEDKDQRSRDHYAHWGEVLGLLARLVPAELGPTVARLAETAPAAATRAVVAAEGPEPWEHLRLLLSLEPDEGWYYPWDNDDLDGVLRTLARRGDGPEALWRAVTPARTARELGVLWYALHWLGAPVDRVGFFAAAGRPVERVPRVVVRSREEALRGVGALDVLSVVDLPAGRFFMGSPDDLGHDDEHPRHEVQLTRPLRLGVVPVTVAQYRRFDPDHECRGESDHPVTMVDWPRAALFAAWVGGRLPTEAEWEYACRAGTDTRWSFGDEEGALAEHGWFDGNSGDKTHPVGKKRPNPWGLYDLHGNVWEWTACRWLPEYGAAVVDPEGPTAGGDRVIRGGSAWHDADRCRSAYRSRYRPAGRSGNLGFRVALPAPSLDGSL
jgi:hypothetical protein